MSPEADLLARRNEHVGIITFNRPERRNSLTAEMLLAMGEVLDGWAAEGEVRAVVITGAGDRAFSAGFDIRAIPTSGSADDGGADPRNDQLRAGSPLEQALDSVKAYPYPTIAMLNGACFGGALDLALCCDLRIAVDDIAVGMPPARLGLVYSHRGLAQFAAVLGQARTRELFFTGRTYRGEEVRELGLVQHLVPRPELAATVMALAGEIGDNAPLALQGIKRVLNVIEAAAPLSEAATAEARVLAAAALTSDDAREGRQAFLEKRRPTFTGR